MRRALTRLASHWLRRRRYRPFDYALDAPEFALAKETHVRIWPPTTEADKGHMASR